MKGLSVKKSLVITFHCADSKSNNDVKIAIASELTDNGSTILLMSVIAYKDLTTDKNVRRSFQPAVC